MRVGVISDTHKDIDNLEQAFDKIVNKEKAEILIHLGDDYDDTNTIEKGPIRIVKVPGVYSIYYKDPDIPNRIIKNYEGWRVLLTHTPNHHTNDLKNDLNIDDLISRKEVDIILHGHTHMPRAEEKDGIIWVNPGHLRKTDRKGFESSFAIIDFSKSSVDIKLLDLKYNNVIRTFKKHR